jgi:hypothetical protein
MHLVGMILLVVYWVSGALGLVWSLLLWFGSGMSSDPYYRISRKEALVASILPACSLLSAILVGGGTLQIMARSILPAIALALVVLTWLGW